MKTMSGMTTTNKIDPKGLLGDLGSAKKPNVGQPGEFKDALNKANELKKASPLSVDPNQAAKNPRVLEFSSHAVDRMRSRGIHFTPDQLDKIEAAHAKAKDKGAKETLILTDSAALIVNVKSDKIVTVMDKGALKDNVFTKIDSTVVV